MKTLGSAVRGVTLLALFSFLGGPFIWLLGVSLKSPVELLTFHASPIPQKFYFQNYADALAKSGIIRAFLNSLYISIASTILICILIALPAYYFARSKGIVTRGMQMWILISQVFPLTLIIIPLFLTLQKLSLVNSHLGLILVYVVINVPFSLWLLRSFVISIPQELEEAATIDGASTTQVIRHIVIPLLLPGIIVVSIFTFISVWNEFLFALVLLADPEKSTLPLKLAQFLGAEGRGRFGALAAATVMAIIPALALFGIVQKKFSNDLFAGATKG